MAIGGGAVALPPAAGTAAAGDIIVAIGGGAVALPGAAGMATDLAAGCRDPEDTRGGGDADVEVAGGGRKGCAAPPARPGECDASIAGSIAAGLPEKPAALYPSSSARTMMAFGSSARLETHSCFPH